MKCPTGSGLIMLSLLATPVLAANKCVDPSGRISYQADPLSGQPRGGDMSLNINRPFTGQAGIPTAGSAHCHHGTRDFTAGRWAEPEVQTAGYRTVAAPVHLVGHDEVRVPSGRQIEPRRPWTAIGYMRMDGGYGANAGSIIELSKHFARRRRADEWNTNLAAWSAADATIHSPPLGHSHHVQRRPVGSCWKNRLRNISRGGLCFAPTPPSNRAA